MAALDSTHQTIADAQADGTGSAQELLVPVVAMQDLRAAHSIVAADAGHREAVGTP